MTACATVDSDLISETFGFSLVSRKVAYMTFYTRSAAVNFSGDCTSDRYGGGVWGSGLISVGLISVIIHGSTDAADLDELVRIRAAEGLRASLRYRDAPFLPEPGGPRSRPRDS